MQDTWVLRTFSVTADRFPGTHRRSVVVHSAVVELNPVEFAIADLCNKNAKLREAITEAEGVPHGQGSQEFSQAINGVVDAAVNGGVTNFVTLLSGEFQHTHPEIVEDMQQHASKVRSPV